MGRKKKYLTEKELNLAKKKWASTFYERNKERLNEASMKKYYELRANISTNNTQS